MIPEAWESSSVRSIACSTHNAIVGGPFGSDLVSKDYVAYGVPVIRGQNMSSRWVSGTFVFVTPTTPSARVTAYWNGPIPWCTPTDITRTPGKYLIETERSVTADGLASCAAILLPVGALLLCSRATIGEIKIAASPVCTNQGFKSLVCTDGVSNEFLYYLLVTLKPRIIERAIGSTFLEIGKRDVASIEVKLPPHGEQRAIATVLSGTDAEIAASEQRRERRAPSSRA